MTEDLQAGSNDDVAMLAPLMGQLGADLYQEGVPESLMVMASAGTIHYRQKQLSEPRSAVLLEVVLVGIGA